MGHIAVSLTKSRGLSAVGPRPEIAAVAGPPERRGVVLSAPFAASGTAAASRRPGSCRSSRSRTERRGHGCARSSPRGTPAWPRGRPQRGRAPNRETLILSLSASLFLSSVTTVDFPEPHSPSNATVLASSVGDWISSARVWATRSCGPNSSLFAGRSATSLVAQLCEATPGVAEPSSAVSLGSSRLMLSN